MSTPKPVRQSRPSRRESLKMLAGVGLFSLSSSLTTALSGCVATGDAGRVDLVWGRRGFSDGRFLKPRAITIDPLDQLYIVDTTGRIQVFDVDGNHLRTWSVPDTANGRPTGLAFDPGLRVADEKPTQPPRLLVADTHYYRMSVFTPDGELQRNQQIGGTPGPADGQFAFVTDAVCDSIGQIYIGEYGASDRIQKFTSDGEFLASWGGTGDELGQFLRPQSLVIDGDVLWIADACNHRIVRYDLRSNSRDGVPELIGAWGNEGTAPGQLHYPYDLAVDRDGTVVVCEYGNQRLQRFSAEGELLTMWGSPGHAPGQLYQPWGVVIDSRGRVHVLDSNNHRVQRVRDV